MELLSQLCERARRWASLRADGELSELEDALLDDHLLRCPACAEFARGFEDVAGALRATGLERPAALDLPLPRRRSRTLLPLVFTVLVVVASAAIAVLFLPSGKPAAAKHVAMVAALESPDRLRELRRPLLIDRRNRMTFGETV